MNPEQKLTTTTRALNTIAILSACVAFMLIGGAIFVKYGAWTNKEKIAKIREGETATAKQLSQETNTDKLRTTALRYQDAYIERCDQADRTLYDISIISLVASLFPILILVRVMNSIKVLRTE